MPAPGQSTIIATELGGDLPCLRCKYNLKGLSIRAVCPECAMPVRATLLAVVDPMASELRPIPRPMLTGLGVVTWSTAALAVSLCMWVARAIETYFSDAAMNRVVHLLGLLIDALTVLSGIGAAALIKPHDGIRVSSRRAALLGVLMYVPLVLVMWIMNAGGELGVFSGSGGFFSPQGVPPDRGVVRIIADLLMILIVIGLRPNARLLASRSLLMRTGRVDRQTMLVLVWVLGVSIVGELAMLAGRMQSLEGPLAQGAYLGGQIIMLVASVLFTLGLVGVVIDCWRMRPVIVESPVSLEGVMNGKPPAPVAAAAPTIPRTS
jgi:hypothetical protein